MSVPIVPPGPPALPVCSVDDAIAASAGSRYSRNTALAVVAMSGGAAGLFEWKNRNAANEADFWTKIFPKTIQKDVVVDDRRSVDDIIMELSAADGTYHARPVSPPPTQGYTPPTFTQPAQNAVPEVVVYDEEDENAEA